MNRPDETLSVVIRVADALKRAGVEYMVGGSMASSAHGEPRSTRDVDFAVRMTEADVPRFVEALGPDFAVDEVALCNAIRMGRSVNIFFLPSFMKIDLFIRGRDEYDRSEFSRKAEIEFASGVCLSTSSPEDILLWKLRWYRMGGEVSDQQWRDVLGLLRVSRPIMEMDYVRAWAVRHGVDDLLDRALIQAAAGMTPERGRDG